MSTLKELAFSKEELLKCTGFSPNFINNEINLSLTSILRKKEKAVLPKVEGNKNGILQYTNLSVFYHSLRKIPFFSAYNVDGGEKKANISRSNSFQLDPRIPSELQLSQKFYSFNYEDSKNKTLRKVFEIGHVAAHNEMSWGKEAQLQTYRTFHFPNSFPQAELLNSGLWKSLESYLINETSAIDKNKKICVFTGPIMLPNDPFYKNDKSFQIPLLFFKVVVFSTEKGIYSTAFVMSHEKRLKELDIFEEAVDFVEKTEVVSEFSDFKYKKVFQVSVGLLEKATGLNFTWKGVKKLKIKDQINQLQIIKGTKNATDAGNQLRTTQAKKEMITMILP